MHSSQRPRAASHAKAASAANAPETISPAWLLRAFLVTLAAAVLCGYLTFCVLFVQGQWQMVLHPVRPGALLPAEIGTAAPETLRFGVDSSGRPQVTGVWLRGDQTRRTLTVLFLPSGQGSLSDAVPRMATLQQLGADVLAFDYRGFGQSAGRHPSQATMESDSEAAVQYLQQHFRVPDRQIVVYGQGVGGFLAARLAARHPSLAAVVVEHPWWQIAKEVAADPRVRLLPVRLLFAQDFDLARLMRSLRTPKLLLVSPTDATAAAGDVADPKMTVTLAATDGEQWRASMRRFLNAYVVSP